jgi:hypothetical protein
VLVALLDLCFELTDKDGRPPPAITTEQLAEKVCELYWPHTRTWSASKPVLVQNASERTGTSGRGGGIVSKIRAFRERVEAGSRETPSLAALRIAKDRRYRKLIQEVERILILMPLPKLQRIGGQNPEWLYHIHWKDESEQDPRHREKKVITQTVITAYQNGAMVFNNCIYLQPGVGMAFARLHGMLRPFILRHWAQKVASLNEAELGDEKLHGFLFGQDRANLQVVLRPLLELQNRNCFYCGDKVGDKAHVDHFIPWSRHPDNGLHNLVVAHAHCNTDKRDYLPAFHHVKHWRERTQSQGEVLSNVATDLCWETGDQRILGVARAIYLALPSEVSLWFASKQKFMADAEMIRSLLVA